MTRPGVVFDFGVHDVIRTLPAEQRTTADIRCNLLEVGFFWGEVLPPNFTYRRKFLRNFGGKKLPSICKRISENKRRC